MTEYGPTWFIAKRGTMALQTLLRSNRGQACRQFNREAFYGKGCNARPSYIAVACKTNPKAETMCSFVARIAKRSKTRLFLVRFSILQIGQFAFSSSQKPPQGRENGWVL